MNDLNRLVSSLSPEKRVLLEKRLLMKNARVPERTPSQSGPRPLSFGQESLWFFDQLDSNRPVYNFPQAMRLRGRLQVEALRQAFETIVHRHESLRTNFISANDRPTQMVSDKKSFALPVIDLSAQPEADCAREIECGIEREARRSFNLAEDLMLRACLFKRSGEEHVLLVSIHHIAADAWSLNLLNAELTALYESFCGGKPSPLPALEFQYSDFALLQREQFQGERAAQQIGYWREQLAGELPVLELPTDRPRPMQQNFHGALKRFKFPIALLPSLNELSRREGVSVYALTLVALNILLQRYSRQDDIRVGSPLSTRNQTQTEKLIGYFLNTVVLRSDLSGNPTFQELLRKIHGNILGALTHPDVSLERLVEELKVPRHAGRNPLVEVLFQYLPAPPQLPKFHGLTVELRPVDNETAHFDLTLTLCNDGDGLMAEVEYNTDLFDAATIDRMLGHYQILLEAIVLNPAEKIADLPLLTTEEKQQLLVEWNETAVPFPTELSIVDLFEKQVAATPEAVAVIFEQEQLTYRELNEKANRLARRLKNLGVQPEDLVGICMDRSIEMLVAVHSVLKAGAAFLPLDPDYPQDRLRFMLDDAQAPVVLTMERLAASVNFGQRKTVCLDAPETVAAESDDNLARKPSPEQLAYVIYTSGSTGQPKGVMISHSAICNQLFWMQSCFPLDGKDLILQKTSFSFDVAVWELLAPVLTGAALVMARPGGQRDAAYLAELIAEKNITILQNVPSTLRALLEEPEFKKCKSLKYVLCGGEKMPAELPQQFASVSNAVLSNNYGPTESAIDATFWICPRGKSRSNLPIGRPIANTEIYLLDSHLQPVPIGVPGELCVSGRGLARGYLRRPELTAEKFIRHPFHKNSAGRLYKTGDLARYLPDGNIEYLGRIDHQVKVRGFRIELGEIETVLRACSGVREAVVTARADGSGENRLAAYWVASEKPVPTEAELRVFLKTKLPQFMVPSAFVAMEALPRNASGKLDWKALPAPDYQPAPSQFVAPRTSLEQGLAQIWCEVLEIQQVGIHDNFFELGGHSLLAARAVSRVRRLNNVSLGLRDFFQSPTVAGISALLEKQGSQNSDVTLPPLTPLARNTKTAGMIVGLIHVGFSDFTQFAPQLFC